MWTDIALILIGVVSTSVLAFVSHDSQSRVAKGLFWGSLMATLGILLYSGIDGINKGKELDAVKIKLEEGTQSISGLTKSQEESKAKERALSEQLQAARAAAERAGLDAQNARSSAQAASKQTEELRVKTKERSFTTNQTKRLLTLLENGQKGSVNISINFGDQEALAFANQIKGILEKAGWKVDGVDQSVFDGQPIGLLILVHSRETAPVTAGVLQKALTEIGYEAPGAINSKVPETTFRLIVGKKK